MKALVLLLGIGACVDAPPVAPDTRHVDLPRGAARDIGLPLVDHALSSDPQIATAAITPGGVRIIGAREGDATIAIDHEGLLTTIVAHVTPPAIVQLAIDPADLSTPVGSEMALHAFATDTTGAIAEVTSLASWRIDDPTIASLEGNELHGMTAGDTVLHAVLTDAVISVPISVR